MISYFSPSASSDLLMTLVITNENNVTERILMAMRSRLQEPVKRKSTC